MTRTSAFAGLTALVLVGAATVQAQPPRRGNPDQRPRLEQRMQGHAGMRGPGFRRGGPGRGMALRGLDLTDEQKTQVKAIHEKTRAEVEAVLTPEQLEKLKARRGGRGR